MDTTEQRAWVTIDLEALTHNLAQARSYAPDSQLVPVIKANGYGHGMAQVATALRAAPTEIAAFAVATLEEALALHGLDLGTPIVLLSGFSNDSELAEILAAGIEPVVHGEHQLAILQRWFETRPAGAGGRLWVKLNTGMNRLGLAPATCSEAVRMLRACGNADLVLMSHLASADEPDRPAAREQTQRQLATFEALREELRGPDGAALPGSFAASAGILGLPATHYQYVRPGIMLYGGSPFAAPTAETLGLRPVMTLKARLLAINAVPAGASIGYGARYVCERDRRIGVVSIGYGDGYPRAAVDGTPVLVQAQGQSHRTQMLGRVSMDMITVDLTSIEGAQVGDEVTLWGTGLAADEIASHAGTISYELFCQVTNRVRREYL